jgi:pimeloyl-ACP methyl ester carboxylesterase
MGSLVKFGDGMAARICPGPGPKILWIHGYTLDSRSWGRLWSLLPEWYHIGIDLPGHGTSLPLGEKTDLPTLARYIGDLAVENGIEHIVALSFGTIIAVQMAIELPVAFRSLVLGAPSLGGGPRDQRVESRYEELHTLYQRKGFGPYLRSLWMRSPPNLFKGAETRAELWSALWEIVGRHPWWELASSSFNNLCLYKQTPTDLRRIRAATLLVVGEDDLDAFKRSAELIRRSVPVCRRVYVSNVGHLCLLEEPALSAGLIDEHLSCKTLA